MKNIVLLFLAFVFSWSSFGASLCHNEMAKDDLPISYRVVLGNMSEALADYDSRQEALYASIQNDLVERLRNSTGVGKKPIPLVEQSTLRILRKWLGYSPRLRYDLLRSSIGMDDYFLWIFSTVKDFPSQYEELYADIDFSGFPMLDGSDGPVLQYPQRFSDFFTVHLLYDGPMRLSPEFLVLRIMRDLDPQLAPELKAKIVALLDIERVKYHLILKISELESTSDRSSANPEYYKSLLKSFPTVSAVQDWFDDIPSGEQRNYFLY
ncbi:MAG: hypothetical protein AAF202_03755 [Pseudomonadota bacterium]